LRGLYGAQWPGQLYWALVGGWPVWYEPARHLAGWRAVAMLTALRIAGAGWARHKRA